MDAGGRIRCVRAASAAAEKARYRSILQWEGFIVEQGIPSRRRGETALPTHPCIRELAKMIAGSIWSLLKEDAHKTAEAYFDVEMIIACTRAHARPYAHTPVRPFWHKALASTAGAPEGACHEASGRRASQKGPT